MFYLFLELQLFMTSCKWCNGNNVFDHIMFITVPSCISQNKLYLLIFVKLVVLPSSNRIHLLYMC